MFLSRHDLSQMDDDYLAKLDADALRRVSSRLLSDLKEARDRLNQNPQNSSRPSGSMPAYLGLPMTPEQTDETDDDEDRKVASKKIKPDVAPDKEGDSTDGDFGGQSPSGGTPDAERGGMEPSPVVANPEPSRRPGRPVGAQGYGRTQIIPPRSIEIHRAEQCAACDAPLAPDAPFSAHTGFYVVDVEENDANSYGVRLFCILHHYGETSCDCGHQTLVMPGRGDHYETADGKVTTTLSEWRLIGPRLASLIVFLAFRMRLSRARIKELLYVWFGFSVSTGTIDHCIHEAALACLPLYLQLMALVHQEPLVHVDETPWKEKGRIPWLWVFASTTITLFVIGKRKQNVALEVLTAEFAGWLMSDGLLLYRIFRNRLRCLAHLIRKAQGLYESLTGEAREFGLAALAVLMTVFSYLKGTCDLEQVQEWIAVFRQYCELMQQTAVHKSTQELAGEFLNDWDAIWRVVEHPELPATNNEAERILRHWVIARLLSHGTRTPEGSQFVAVLASIIETCRKRGVDTWNYLARVIAARRKGEEPAPIPKFVDNKVLLCSSTA
jgi:transposase